MPLSRQLSADEAREPHAQAARATARETHGPGETRATGSPGEQDVC